MRASTAAAEETAKPQYQSLWGEHTVRLFIKPLVPDALICGEDRKELGLTTLRDGHETWYTNDLPAVLDAFVSNSADGMAGLSLSARARFMLEQTALDQFEAQRPLKRPEDFEITAIASDRAVSAAMRYLASRKPKCPEEEGPSP